MIDYEKLKKCHELLERLPFNYILTMRKSGHLFPSYDMKLEYEFDADTNSFKKTIEHKDLGGIINVIQSLTQDKPKPKYENIAWFLHKGEIKGYKPNGFEDGMYYFGPILGWWDEECLYPTKQALVESQIAYWSKMKEEL